MLFDLSGKRKNVVRVVYATLAILMGGSLVLFGIGSDAPGGILDAFGLGSGDSGATSPQYEEQIEAAEERLETDPEDETALLELTRYHYLSATENISTDPETGATSITEDARVELEDSVAAWERYVATKPSQPDAGVASNAAEAYKLLSDPDGAAAAQEIIAQEQKTAAAYFNLAYYLYVDGRLEAGDAAGQEAIAAAEPSDRALVKRRVDALAEDARRLQKQLEQQQREQQGEAGQIEDPFGALGGGSTAPTPVPTP